MRRSTASTQRQRTSPKRKQRSAESAIRLSLSATPTAEPSSPALEPTIALSVGLHLCACTGRRREFADAAVQIPDDSVFSQIEVVDGRIWLRREGTRFFCGDLSEQEQQLVWATQGVPKPDLFEAKAGGTAWKSKPSWYIVGKKDHTVHPDLERAWPSAWAQPPMSSTAAMCRCSPNRNACRIIRTAAKAVQEARQPRRYEAPVERVGRKRMKLNSVLLEGVIVSRDKGSALCEGGCDSENSSEDDA